MERGSAGVDIPKKGDLMICGNRSLLVVMEDTLPESQCGFSLL